MAPFEALIHAWQEEAARLRSRYAEEGCARLCEAHAEELEALLRDHCSEILSLEAAAGESGFSTDHLARLVREGKLPNAGRHGAPRIRRADLPKKRGSSQEKGAKPEERGNIEGLFRDIVESKYGGN